MVRVKVSVAKTAMTFRPAVKAALRFLLIDGGL
jgi:hypothetical protein